MSWTPLLPSLLKELYNFVSLFLAKDIVIVMEENKGNLFDTYKKNTKKNWWKSDNSETEFVNYKRKKIEENEKRKITEQDRKKEL